ncbi:MAG: GNAT family protein [Pseudomonadota bacterium]
MDQPVGEPVPTFTPPQRPDGVVLEGRHVRVLPLDVDDHATDLFAAFAGHPELWTYMSVGPFEDLASFRTHLSDLRHQTDTVFVAFCTPEGRAIGMGSYLRILPKDGSIEVGNLVFSPEMQGSIAATEAMHLMMAWAFDAGYRRYEWKCNALNIPSRRAATRLGFSFEGIFRQAMIVKGRNRDTAWFAVIDKDWPDLARAHLAWLDPSNFDQSGAQKTRLSEATAPLLHLRDPIL